MHLPSVDQILEIMGAVSALCTLLARVAPQGSKVGKLLERIGVSFGRHS